ncbi:MAG: PEGA domain-containing protein, partial [Kofleriaceae bacterium]
DQRDIPTMAIREAPPSPNKQNRWLLIGTVSAIVIAGGIWLTHDMFGRSRDEAPVVANAPDAGTKPDARQVAIAASDAAIDAAIDAASDAASDAAAVPTALDAGSAVPPGDAVAAQVIDAGAPPVIDAAAQPAIDAGATATPSDSLVVTSKPAGARVFLDGADMGVTPLKQPGTADRHTLAIMLPGHELYVAQVDGKGSFAIPLKEVTPTGGPAGIKVLKCKDKDRYYVFVDGKPTGQTCPTERIETEVGSHVVEVYDVTNDSRRKWEIDVKDTRLSVRVKID